MSKTKNSPKKFYQKTWFHLIFISYIIYAIFSKKVNNSDPVLPRAPARAVASVPARPSAPLLMIENAPRLLMIKNAPAPVSAPVSAPVANTVRTANLPVVYSPPFRPAPGTARPRPPPPSGYKGKGGKKTRRRRNIKRRTSVSKR